MIIRNIEQPQRRRRFLLKLGTDLFICIQNFAVRLIIISAGLRVPRMLKWVILSSIQFLKVVLYK